MLFIAGMFAAVGIRVAILCGYREPFMPGVMIGATVLSYYIHYLVTGEWRRYQ